MSEGLPMIMLIMSSAVHVTPRSPEMSSLGGFDGVLNRKRTEKERVRVPLCDMRNQEVSFYKSVET